MVTIKKASGKSVYVASEDQICIDAAAELNGRQRGRAARLERIAAAGGPKISHVEIVTEKIENPGKYGPYNRIINESEVNAANAANATEHRELRIWLLSRLGISEEAVAQTPGHSGQFDPSISTI
jgi:hypothetical protein